MNTAPTNRSPPPYGNPNTLDYRVTLFPIVVIELYLTASVLLFAFGPWPWPVPNPGKLYTYLILAFMARAAGYWVGLKWPQEDTSRRRPGWKRLLLVSMILWVILYFPTFIQRTGTASPSQAIASLFEGIRSPGTVYNDKVANMENMGSNWYVSIPLFLLSPILCLWFPVGIVFWSELRWRWRMAFVALVGLDTLTWIASGTNKGIFDLALSIPILYVAGHPSILRRFTSWLVIKVALLGCVLVCCAVMFFASGAISRGSADMQAIYDRDAQISANQSHPLLAPLPQDMRYAVATLCSYLGQGYYGLALCLELPFVPTYGLGHAYYMTDWARKYMNLIDVSDSTYPARSQWNALRRWHTLYPWVASDVTFTGALFFVSILSFIFTLAWRDTVHAKNPIAAAVFLLMLIALFYIPANNQVFGFQRAAFSAWSLSALWFTTRRRAFMPDGANSGALRLSRRHDRA